MLEKFKKFQYSLSAKIGIAAIDQALISAVNFIVSIMLMKFASKIEYGYYSIGFAVILFIISIQNSIVNTPLAVLFPGKKDTEKNKYSAAIGYGQFIIILPIVFLGLMTIGLLYFMGYDSTKTIIAAMVTIALVFILLKEFFRAYYFAIQKPNKVLKMDAFYSLFSIASVVILFRVFNLSASNIFLVIGICSFAVGIIANKNLNWEINQLPFRKSFIENWIYGRWSLLGVIATHIQNYSYIYFLGAILGSTAVADVSAARFLMMPLILLQSGWIKIIVPYGSNQREKNLITSFYKKQIIFGVIFVLIVIIYSAALLLFSEFLQTYILPDKYQSSFNLILQWGIIFSIGFVGLNASYGLLVVKRFDIVSKVNIVTMLITIVSTYFLIKSAGIKGGLNALVIGTTVNATSLWIFFRMEIKRNLKIQLRP